MQIRVDTFRNKLELLKMAIPKKTNLPVLHNACVINGKIAATDLDIRVILNLPEAGEEQFLIPYAAVTEVLRYVPGDQALTIEPRGKGLKITCHDGTFSYLTADVHDYPDLAVKDALVAEGMLNGDKMLMAFLEAETYCATETDRPVLNGVHLYLGDVIQVAGADGSRASFESLNMAYPWKGVIIIPQATVGCLRYLWHKCPPRPAQRDTLVGNLVGAREFKLSLLKGDSILIQFGEITLHSRLISGNPPDILKLLSAMKEPVKVSLMAPDMWYAVRRVEGIARNGSGITRLQWTDSKMTVSASSAEKGEVSADFPVQAGSQPGRIALNVKYILEYLAGKDGLITMGIETQTGPALFHYGSKPIVAIMPMHADWGDEKPAEPQPEPPAEDIKENVAVEPASGKEAAEGMEAEVEGTETREEETQPVAAAPSGNRKKPRGRRKKKTE